MTFPHQSARRWIANLAIVTAGSIVVSCNDIVGPLPSSDLAPRREFVDARNGGPAGFYFLPPLAPVVVYEGTFDADRSPVVAVCRVAGDTCGLIVATFETGGGGAGAVRVDSAAGHYLAQWHTRQSGVAAGETYRVRVLDGSTELGRADIRIVKRAGDARDLADDVIPIVAGATVPIKFRIERSTLGEPVTEGIGTRGGAITAFLGGGAEFTLDIPEGALDSTIAFTITPLTPGNGGLGAIAINPSNLFFRKPVTLKFSLPGTIPNGVADSLAIGLGTPAAPRQLILRKSLSGSVLTGETQILGNPGPPLFLQAQSQNRFAFASVTDDEATAMAEAFIADVQAAIDAHNTRAAQLLAVRSFEEAIKHRMAAQWLAQYIGESDAAADAYAAGLQATCTALEVENGLAVGRVGGDFANLWDALRPLISLHAGAGIYGVGESCTALTAFGTVVREIATEFARLYTEAMQRPTFPQNVVGIRRELFKAIAAKVYASSFADEFQLVTEVVQLPLAQRYRRASYAWCRTDFQQSDLGYLFRVARDTIINNPISPNIGYQVDAQDDLGMTARELWLDVQLCGTVVQVWNRNESGVPTLHGPLGGGDEPGSFKQVDSIRVNPHGTIELDSLLIAYECSNEELGNDRILVRFNGQQVRYLDRIGVTRHFLRINPAVFNVDSLARVGGVDLREGGTFPLEVLREGNACNGEYFLPSENSPNLLFTLNLRYPKIQVALNPDTAALDPGESRSFTASVTGTDSTGVTWEVGGGDWSIDGNTLTYTAGNSPGIYRIIARSVVDTARADTAVVQIGGSCPAPASAAVSGLFTVASCEAVTLSVSPVVTTVLVEGSTTFAAAVSGTSNTSVMWTATGGTIDAAGVYTAGTVPGLYKVFARSIADNSVVDSAQVHVVTLIPLITYRGTGSIAQARGFASTAFGGSYTYNESARIDTLATEGSVSVTGGGATVTNGSTTSKAEATSSVAMNLDVQSGRLVFGTSSGSLTATAITEGGGTGSAGAETNTSFAIEFTVNSFSKIHLIVNAGTSGACVGRGTTVIDHLGASPSRITLVSPTQDFNQEIPLLIGRNLLNVTVTCFPNTSTGGIVGTQTGAANFKVDFAFKPQ